MRNEKGLLVYNREEFRNLCTEKENALNDEYMEKFHMLFSKYDRGEISKDEYEHLAEELDDEHTAAYEKLYDEEFGNAAANDDEKFFALPMFAHA